MIVLRPTNLHWLGEDADNPGDVCAHGDVEFRIGQDALLTNPSGYSPLSLSAAALYLLRTLSAPRASGGAHEPLFPCCGHAMYAAEGQEDVDIVGCGGGEEFEVLHDAKTGSAVTIRGAAGEWDVRREEWRAAVFAFTDAVSAFYAASAAKPPPSDEHDAAAWAAFQLEWLRRRGVPLGGHSRMVSPGPAGHREGKS